MWSGCDLDDVLKIIGLNCQTSGGRKLVFSDNRFLSYADIAVRHRRLEGLSLVGLPGIGSAADGLEFGIGCFEEEKVMQEKDAYRVLCAMDTVQEIIRVIRSSEREDLAAWLGSRPGYREFLDDWLPKFNDDGELRVEKFPELVRLEKRCSAAYGELQDIIKKVTARYESVLQDSSIAFRDEHYCLQVRTGMQNEITGLYMGLSSTGQTVFIEPMEIMKASTSFRMAREQIQIEKLKIISTFSQELSTRVHDLHHDLLFLHDLDRYQAFRAFMDQSGGSLPDIVDVDEDFIIQNGRHPLVDERFGISRQRLFDEKDRNATVIPLDVTWPARNSVLILSGPNGGGKTVALKTTALIAVLGRCGWPVPAGRGTRIPEFRDVMLYVGDEQDVLHDLSTFTAAMHHLNQILAEMTRGVLLFVDEAGFGTDPEEGASLAASILQFVKKQGGRSFVTTHLSSLKLLPLEDSSFVNASMEFDQNSMQPTYLFQLGFPGSSHALDVAESVGIHPEILKDARQRLGPDNQQRDEYLKKLQAMVHDYRNKLSELENTKVNLQEEKARVLEEAVEEKARLKREVEEWKKQTLDKLSGTLKKLRDSGVKIGKKREQSIRTIVRETPDLATREDNRPESIRTGMMVKLSETRLKGRVLALQDASGLVCVSVEGKQVWVEPRQLEITGGEEPTGSLTSDTSASRAPLELNLVGLTVDEAIDELDVMIDRALLSGSFSLNVIHGHGTGKLRSAVRDYLKKHPAVRKQQPGHDNGSTEVFF